MANQPRLGDVQFNLRIDQEVMAKFLYEHRAFGLRTKADTLEHIIRLVYGAALVEARAHPERLEGEVER